MLIDLLSRAVLPLSFSQIVTLRVCFCKCFILLLFAPQHLLSVLWEGCTSYLCTFLGNSPYLVTYTCLDPDTEVLMRTEMTNIYALLKQLSWTVKMHGHVDPVCQVICYYFCSARGIETIPEMDERTVIKTPFKRLWMTLTNCPIPGRVLLKYVQHGIVWSERVHLPSSNI